MSTWVILLLLINNFDAIMSFNWNLLPQDIMESSLFKNSLIAIHLFFLVYFLFLRWLNWRTMFKDLGIYPLKIWFPFSAQNPYYVAEVFLICNFVGIVWARGLHAQFQLWYIYSVPFLLSISVCSLFEIKSKYLVYLYILYDFLHVGSARHRYTAILSQMMMLFVFTWICITAYRNRLKA